MAAAKKAKPAAARPAPKKGKAPAAAPVAAPASAGPTAESESDTNTSDGESDECTEVDSPGRKLTPRKAARDDAVGRAEADELERVCDAEEVSAEIVSALRTECLFSAKRILAVGGGGLLVTSTTGLVFREAISKLADHVKAGGCGAPRAVVRSELTTLVTALRLRQKESAALRARAAGLDDGSSRCERSDPAPEGGAGDRRRSDRASDRELVDELVQMVTDQNRGHAVPQALVPSSRDILAANDALKHEPPRLPDKKARTRYA